MGGWEIFGTLLAAVLGGGAFTAFIQFLITRHDNKKAKKSGIAGEIQSIKTDLEGLRSELSEDRATNARIRILQFSDDLRHGISRSKESFDQIHQDIDRYNSYCKEHAEYENSLAVAAIKYIEAKYQDYLDKDGFLD